MRIERVINNNVISALDDQGREIVAMGRGIGFQKKSGQEIKAAQVEKIFHLGSPDLQARFQELLANMPMECVQVSDEIISYAKSHLSMQLNQNVYLALTDHIDFALRRFKDGMLFENALYSEIRRFYPEEFQIGCHALDLIEERIKVRLPEDEVSSGQQRIWRDAPERYSDYDGDNPSPDRNDSGRLPFSGRPGL